MYNNLLRVLLIPSAALAFSMVGWLPAGAEQVEGDRSSVDELSAVEPLPAGDLAAADLGIQSVTAPSLQTQIEASLPAASAATVASPEVATPAPTEAVTEFGMTRREAMSQVTSVSQLSDVQPTDWAFQALQSLVERYGVIAGYPDGTFRGSRAMTRYEFAAGLNAAMDRVNELIAAGLAETVSEEDLAVLQRMQEEFAAELATLRGRVDALESRTAELEANQFSTTTKLSGVAFFNLTGAFADGPVSLETTNANAPFAIRPAGRDPITGRPVVQEIDDDPSITFSNLVWLNFNTSFTGRDSLVTQLAVGNGNSPANAFVSAGLYNTFGVPFTDQNARGPSDVILREMFYSFPVGDSVQMVVGPRINWYRHFDGNAFTFFFNGAGSFNSGGSTLLNTIDRGAGAVAMWDISDKFQLNLAYLGENTEFLPGGLFNTATNPSEGLFGGTNTISAQLTYSPTSTFNLRLLYNHSNLNAVFGQVGGSQGEPLYGFADDGAGGPLNDGTADTFMANFDWLITPGFGIFSRYTYGSTHIEPGDINAQSFQAGLAFPDLGKEGAQATLSYLIPFSVIDGREFLVSGGGDGGIQYEFEATYYYPLTNNIALVPSVYFIANPNNFDDNPTIVVGNLRAQFTF